jgi:hypothetical protein
MVIGLGVGFVFRARRAYTRPVDRLLESDVRPPVLYLRSFSDDTNKASGATVLDRLVSLALGLAHPGLLAQNTIEMKLCNYLKTIGPVIAIGKPGEHLPKLGATRLYVRDDHWRTVASDLMDRARLVVLRAGATPGLQWEWSELLSRKLYDKILIFLAFRHGFWGSSRDASYARFRDWVEPCLRRPFPATIGDFVFMFIDPDGCPQLLDTEETLASIYPNHPLLPLFTWMQQRGFLNDVGKPFIPIKSPASRKAKESAGGTNAG